MNYSFWGRMDIKKYCIGKSPLAYILKQHYICIPVKSINISTLSLMIMWQGSASKILLLRSPLKGSLTKLGPSVSLYNMQKSLISNSFRYNYSTANSNFSRTTKEGTNQKKKEKVSLWPRIKSYSTFTASTALIIGATGISTIVIYLILTELFSPSGDTIIFNRAVTMVEKNEAVRTLLQCQDNGKKLERLKAYGELLTNDKWTRNRPISSTKKIDRNGKEHYFMRFHVESKRKLGLVHVELKESEKHYQPDFLSMYIDVKGEKRFYIVKPKLHKIVRPRGFLGVNWGPRKQ